MGQSRRLNASMYVAARSAGLMLAKGTTHPGETRQGSPDTASPTSDDRPRSPVLGRDHLSCGLRRYWERMPGSGPWLWWAYGVVVGLPSGTVTLLITDIEDSTRRWLEDRSGMEAALARHDRLLYEVVEAHRGSVFKHTGDGICAAFEAAGDAVAAAVTAQSELELPVRMGLHTGELTPTGGDYHGTVVNEAARVADAGHGGQIVLSAATASLVDGGSLTDLGSHQLKGLNRLTRLWQFGPGSFPPLRVTTALAGTCNLTTVTTGSGPGVRIVRPLARRSR